MWKRYSRGFQPGEGPSRGLLRDYEPSDGTFSSTNHCAVLGAGKLQTPLVTWLLATLRSRVSHSSITHVSCDHLLLLFFTGHQSLVFSLFVMTRLMPGHLDALSCRCYGFVLFDMRRNATAITQCCLDHKSETVVCRGSWPLVWSWSGCPWSH